MDGKRFSGCGFGQVWYYLRFHFVELVGLNLLFLVCCLPVVTIPSAYCGLNAVLTKWIRGLPAHTVEDFFREFRQHIAARFALWAVMMIAPMSIAWYLSLFGIGRDGTAARLVGYLLVFLLQCWWFAVMALIEVPVWASFKNAVLLLAGEWPRTVRLMLSAGILYGIFLFFPLYMIPVGVICFFSFTQLIVCLELTDSILDRLSPANSGENGETI